MTRSLVHYYQRYSARSSVRSLVGRESVQPQKSSVMGLTHHMFSHPRGVDAGNLAKIHFSNEQRNPKVGNKLYNRKDLN